ncbi:hypothetical protein Glove_110g66 [Diversispora epigaea]|uniref:Uncharacterized protein n=1 Tax=Diversispora epigaea TaxID=1348612 RepID=A0A397J5H6_9GLOM|nr:hypothetical protein Glove_110g66 [Diversispora epigaea]
MLWRLTRTVPENLTKKSISINVDNSAVSLHSASDRRSKLRLRSSRKVIIDGIGKVTKDYKIESNSLSNIFIKIYMDGLLLKIIGNNSQTFLMGCDWYASSDNNEYFMFSENVKNFISSIRTELFAILIVVYTTLCYSNLYIFIDSQAAIDDIFTIEEIANFQKLSIRLEKIKTYSGIMYNELVDKLAKEGLFESNCSPDLQSLVSVNTVGCWNDEIIEELLRYFTKKLRKAEYSIQWRFFNQNISFILEYKSQNNRCICCKTKKEDQIHILTCIKNSVDIHLCKKKFIDLVINNTMVVACSDTCRNFGEELEKLEDLHISLVDTLRDVNNLSFVNIMLRFILITVYDIIIQKVITRNLEVKVRICNNHQKRKVRSEQVDVDNVIVSNSNNSNNTEQNINPNINNTNYNHFYKRSIYNFIDKHKPIDEVTQITVKKKLLSDDLPRANFELTIAKFLN